MSDSRGAGDLAGGSVEGQAILQIASGDVKEVGAGAAGRGNGDGVGGFLQGTRESRDRGAKCQWIRDDNGEGALSGAGVDVAGGEGEGVGAWGGWGAGNNPSIGDVQAWRERTGGDLVGVGSITSVVGEGRAVGLVGEGDGGGGAGAGEGDVWARCGACGGDLACFVGRVLLDNGDDDGVADFDAARALVTNGDSEANGLGLSDTQVTEGESGFVDREDGSGWWDDVICDRCAAKGGGTGVIGDVAFEDVFDGHAVYRDDSDVGDGDGVFYDVIAICNAIEIEILNDGTGLHGEEKRVGEDRVAKVDERISA